MMMAMKKIPIYNEIDLENKKVKTDDSLQYDSLQYDYINYFSIPSLESIAVVSIATVLCKQSDIRDKLRQHSFKFDPIVEGTLRRERGTFCDNSFHQIEKEILNKLSSLPLPKQLKANVSNTIRPIELQILAWLRYDRKDVEYIDSICWTNQGTIDKIKTLKQLIHEDKGQHIHSLFKLACGCCLEESIPDLWGKLPEETKDDYLRGKRIYKNYDSHLMAYWANSVNNELSRLFGKLKRGDRKNIYKSNHSVYKNMLTLALSEGNSLAVKYFWNKLTDVEIHNNLEQWIKDTAGKMKDCSYYQDTNGYADILYFLLSKVNDKEQQKHLLQENVDTVLISLFKHWPWQRFFLPTINEMWEFIDEKVYVKLLSRIIVEIRENKTTEKLFRSLWCQSPMDLKNCIIQRMLNFTDGTFVLGKLLTVEDVGTIKIILNDTTMELQKRIIFLSVERGDFFEAIYKGKFSQVGNILIELLSESEVNRAKKIVVSNLGNHLCHQWLYHNDWNAFENFLLWAFTSEDQINIFKSETLNKIDITHALLKRGNYNLVEKFLDWCFGSEQEINRFKKHFAKVEPEIVHLAYEEWCLFEKFLDWCFDSAEEINDFKSDVLRSGELWRTIHDSIAFGYNFEFIDKILSWCCRSEEEIKQFKAQFVVSRQWFGLLQRFVSNYKVYDSEWNNWELIKKLVNLFSPFEDDMITDLKKAIENEIDFDDFRPDYKNRSFRIEKKHLFRLLDNKDCNIDDDESDEDYDISIPRQDPTIVRVLADLLDEVEKDSLGETITCTLSDQIIV